MTSKTPAVFQIQVSDNGNTVVSSFARAIDHIAASSTSDTTECQRWDSMGGSYAQKVRYTCETKYDSLCIIEHNPDVMPGLDTDMFWLDLVNDFDPSYELQRALYLLEENSGDIEDAAARLETTIRDGLEAERRDGDERTLQRLQKIERLMESESVIPQADSASSALDQLPDVVMQRFHAHVDRLNIAAPAL